MADSPNATNKVVPFASAGRRALTRETAHDNFGWEKSLELFDVSQLVLDSIATRSDLRLIEESDDEVQQCLETRIDTLLGIDYRLDGGSDAVKEFLAAQLKRHYDTIVTNAFNAKLYGYSVMERVWAYRDGYWIVDRLPEKPFEWFIPKRDETLWYRKNSPIVVPAGEQYGYPLEGEQVDTEFKFLLTRHKPTWKNPRGRPLLAYLFWPWFYRKITWQFWMQFLERSGSPLLVGKGSDPAAIAIQLAAAIQDAVIGVPKDGEVEAISPANKGEAFGLAEDRLVRRIQKVLLGQTLTSDTAVKGSGAKSLGEVHEDVRQQKTVGDLKIVGPTVQNYIDALIRLNFPSSRPVRLIYNLEQELGLARAGRDVTWLNTGVIGLTKEYFMRKHGLLEDEFEVLSVKEQAAAALKAKEQAGEKQKQQQDKSDKEDKETNDD